MFCSVALCVMLPLRVAVCDVAAARSRVYLFACELIRAVLIQTTSTGKRWAVKSSQGESVLSFSRLLSVTK